MFSFNNISEFLDKLSGIESGLRTALESNDRLYDRIHKCKDIPQSARSTTLNNIATISRDIKILLRKIVLLATQAQYYDLQDSFPDELKSGIEEYYKEVRRYNLDWQQVYVATRIQTVSL